MRLFKAKKDKLIQYEIQTFFKPEIKEKPPELEDAFLDSISSEEAIALLSRNLPLENKIINGDLILGRQDIENPFELDTEDGRKVQMAGLPGKKDFARLPYQTRIEAKRCIFRGKVILAGLDFKQEIRFYSVRFCAEVDLQYAIFNRSLTCYGCCFHGRIILSDSTFWDHAQFDRTVFMEPADFFNATFQKGASFTYAVFRAYCTFSSAHFNCSMLLYPCLNFINTICQEAAYFLEARFDGIADFGGASFNHKVDFTSATFRYINLKQAQFGWLEIKWEQLGHNRLLFGTVTVPGVDLSKKTVSEEEFNDCFFRRADAPLPEKHRQFDIIKGIFLKQGDFVSADQCFYDWKQIERKKSPVGWNPESWIVKIFHCLNWLSCGYGVKPIRTLFFASILIFLFGIVFTVMGPSANPDLRFFSLNNIALSSFFGNLEYSFLVFMNFTAVAPQVGSIPHLFYLLERILGWITLLLFVTTYTRIMLR